MPKKIYLHSLPVYGEPEIKDELRQRFCHLFRVFIVQPFFVVRYPYYSIFIVLI